MNEEVLALEAQNKSLQSLVGELLMTNQRLREKIKLLEKQQPATPAVAYEPNEPATHPRRHRVH